MFRIAFTLSTAALLSGCAFMPEFVGRSETGPTTPVATQDLRFGGGFRGSDDPCVRLGPTEFTAPFLRTDGDLVGCPIDFEGRPAFIRSQNATEAARTDAWVLYDVPLANAPVTEFGPMRALTGG